MAFTKEQFQSVLRRNAEHLRRARVAYSAGDCQDALRSYTDFARTTGALVAMNIETPGIDASLRREVDSRVKTVETFQTGLRARCVRR
jgi:hypothetical protein